MAARKKSDREIELEKLIADVERIGKAAEARRSWTAALGATTRVAALKEELHRHRELTRISGIRDPAKKLRAQHDLALAAGSFVAASRLAEAEARLAAELAASAARKAEVELDGLSIDALVGIIIEAIPHLPIDARDQIADALGCDLPVSGDLGDGDA